jgi:mono/diheme cytochrome c family protein
MGILATGVAMAGCVGVVSPLLMADPSVLTSAQAQATTPAAAAAAPDDSRPLLERYCVGCHNDKAKIGGLTLQGVDPSNVATAADTWEKVVRRLRADSMPPVGRPRPDAAVRDRFVASVEHALDARAARHPDPGRTAIFHRLNRNEYQNAVRDLLGVDGDIAAMLPPDGQNYAFDNIGDALTMSPLLLDRYLSVSYRVSRLAMGEVNPRPVAETYVVPTDLGGQDERLEDLPYGTRGGHAVHHQFPVDGDYEFSVKLMRNYNFQVVDLNEPHQLELLIDDERRRLFAVAPLPGPRVLGGPEPDDNLRFVVPVKAGRRRVAVTFIRRSAAYTTDERAPFIRGDAKLNALHGQPWLGEIAVTGPLGQAAAAPVPAASRARFYTCEPSGPGDQARCARQMLTSLARRAFRRPVTDADVEPLLTAYAEGARGNDFRAGLEMAIQRLLMSPSFLFRIERDPPAASAPYRISDIALASRLSFFLWSSIPDDELLRLAEARRLSEPAVLEAQVRRMLADAKAVALTKNFTGQWLELRKLAEVQPDQQLFPNFDGTLRDAFQRESELLFDSVLREDRPFLDLLTADYTFVNERLARHYGIRGVYGDRFRRVPLDAQRRGLLGHGSILTVTSYANRTSPVLRGVWVLENLLGTPPPPPPPDVPDLKDTNDHGRVLSMRERMVQHRRNPTCASCHALMDPLGLALENFDAIGSWRARGEDGATVDASGTLPNGTAFGGVDGLRDVLASRSDVYYRTLTEKLLIYALGRNVETADAPAVRSIMRDAARREYRAQALVLAIVKSLPFQMKRGAAAPPTVTVQ